VPSRAAAFSARLKPCPDTKPVSLKATRRSGLSADQGSRCSIRDCPQRLKPLVRRNSTARLKPCPSVWELFRTSEAFGFCLLSNRESKARPILNHLRSDFRACGKTRYFGRAFRPGPQMLRYPRPDTLSSRPERTRISCHAALTNVHVCGFP
jgi:hypothetical protein